MYAGGKSDMRFETFMCVCEREREQMSSDWSLKSQVRSGKTVQRSPGSCPPARIVTRPSWELIAGTFLFRCPFSGLICFAVLF